MRESLPFHVHFDTRPFIRAHVRRLMSLCHGGPGFLLSKVCLSTHAFQALLEHYDAYMDSEQRSQARSRGTTGMDGWTNPFPA